MSGRNQGGGRRPVDEGWSQMSALLDREMPVRRRRYRAAVLMFFALAFGIAIYLSIPNSTTADQHRGDPVRQPGIQETEQPALQSEKPENGESVITAAVDQQAKDGLHGEKHVADDPGAKPGTVTPNQALSPGEFRNSSVRGTSSAKGGASRQGENSRPAGERGSQSPDRQFIVMPGLESSITQLAEQMSPGISAPQSRTPIIPPMMMQPESIEPLVYRPQSTTDLQLVRPPKRSKLGLVAFGAGHVAADPGRLRGVEAGLAMEYAVAPRWSVSLGTSYAHYNESGLLRSGADDEAFKNLFIPADVDPDTVSFGSPVNVDASTALLDVQYDTARQFFETLGYVQVPLAVAYRVSPRFSLEAGVRFGFLVSAPLAQDLNFGLSGTGLANRVLDSRSAGSDLRDTDLVTNVDVAPSFGLAYHASPRIDLYAQLNYGLTPYVNRSASDSRSDYNRTLALGLRYHIF